mgnify:CR=1 FL=1|tara:strand:- start:203 stop:889 length:687 start_codon:yes stop_codon:yes gene_type:complete
MDSDATLVFSQIRMLKVQVFATPTPNYNISIFCDDLGATWHDLGTTSSSAVVPSGENLSEEHPLRHEVRFVLNYICDDIENKISERVQNSGEIDMDYIPGGDDADQGFSWQFRSQAFTTSITPTGFPSTGFSSSYEEFERIIMSLLDERFINPNYTKYLLQTQVGWRPNSQNSQNLPLATQYFVRMEDRGLPPRRVVRITEDASFVRGVGVIVEIYVHVRLFEQTIIR